VVVAIVVWRLPNRHTCTRRVTVPAMDSRSRGQAPDGLVHVDVDIRFVNNLPTFNCLALATKGLSRNCSVKDYSLSNELFNNVL
jgi:hypothetical protein